MKELEASSSLSRGPARRSWLQWLARLGLTALVLTILATRIDLRPAFDAMRQADAVPVALAVLAYGAYRAILAYQMSFGLAPLGMRGSVSYLIKVTLIAGFYSLVLPGGLLTGGAATWYKLARSSGKAVEAAALVVFFRLLNTLVLLSMGLAALGLDAQVPSTAARAVGLTLGLAVAVLLAPIASVRAAASLAGLGHRLSRHCWLPSWVRRCVGQAWTAAIALQGMSKRAVAQIIGLSVLMNGMGIVFWLLLARSVGIGLSAASIGWISAFLTIAMLIPVTIAGLGVREVSLVVLMGAYGIPPAQALGFSLLILSFLVLEAFVGGLLECGELVSGVVARHAGAAFTSRPHKRAAAEATRAIGQGSQDVAHPAQR